MKFNIFKILAMVLAIGAFTGNVYAQLGAYSPSHPQYTTPVITPTSAGVIYGYHSKDGVDWDDPVPGSNFDQCNGCHSGGSYTGSASFSIPSTVSHGETSARPFTFVVSTTAPGWGFNIAIYNPSDAPLTRSSYDNLSSHINQTDTDHNGELQHYVMQTTTSDPSFDFVAPDVLGTYTIYGCLNQVNGDGLGYTTGDGPPECASDTFKVINDAPDAVADIYTDLSLTALDITQNQSTGNFNVLTNDSDTESDAFDVTLPVTPTGTHLDKGTLSCFVNGNCIYDPVGAFDYLDDSDPAEFYTFDYQVDETVVIAGGCNGVGDPCRDTALVTIRVTGVNDAPVANDDSYPVNEGGILSVNLALDGILFNDTDVDVGDDPEVVRPDDGVCNVDPDPTIGTLGTIHPTDGTFTYTHLGGEESTDSFTYCVSDGDLTSMTEATVTININPINDKPEVGRFVGYNFAYTEQASAEPLAANLTVTDVDDDNIESATVTISPYDTGNDVLGCGVFDVDISCSQSGDTLTLTGSDTKLDYQTKLRSLTYSNNADDPNDSDRTLTLIIYDDGDTGSSADDIPSVAVQKTITFTAVDDAPIASDDGTALSPFLTVTEGDPATDSGSSSVLDNDDGGDFFDGDGDAITATQVGCDVAASGPSFSTAFTLDSDGTFNYTHDGSENPADSFTYCATEGDLNSARVTVYIGITA
ncbi:MAG: hypothetical protein ACI8XC_002602, partial [Gammaproteobacteria bacterium]